MSENVNTTVNGTQPWSCHWNPTVAKIGGTFAYCLVFLVSLAANTFIGIIVYKTKTMRKPINFLVVNMAMSDLLFPIFLFPIRVQMLLLYKESWLIGGPLGQALCKLVRFLPDVSSVVSIQSLVLIAVGRFGAVVYPLHSPLISSKLCPFFILVTWIVAMAVYSPYLFAFRLVESHGGLVCRWHWEEAFGDSSFRENYFLSLFVALGFIPFIVIAVLYIIIFLKLKSQRSPGKQSANAGQQRQQRERNVLKMAIAIVLGFAVCWLPFFIAVLLSFFAWDIRPPCSFQYFIYVTTFMARANCAVNPCFCFIFSGNYREGLKNLFR